VTATIHLNPTAPLASRVLLPGDPGRALLLAQELLAEPRMFNHNRGLWGYSGEAADGEPLTIQSTGMGGPSAAIVIAELVELGARLLVRVGTCGALDGTLELGELLVATAALAADGTSRALGAGDQVQSDFGLATALRRSDHHGLSGGLVVSTDLFYDGREGEEREWAAAGARAVEMETATLFALAERRGFRAGSVLIVSDTLLPQRRRIDPDRLQDAERRLGRVAVAALTADAARAGGA
jgi:uridine phosphorylase